MKLKLFFFIMLLPFAAMAANTNVMDRVLIRSIFQFTGGTPSAGAVLTSDAAGFYTPQSLQSLGGFAYTNQNNFFTTASINTFNASTFTSNLFVRGQLNINTNSTYNPFYSVVSHPLPGQTLNYNLIEFHGGATGGILMGDPDGGGPGASYEYSGGGIFSFIAGGSGFTGMRLAPNNVTMLNLTPTVVTLGASSASTLILNGNPVTIPNGINIGSGQLIIPSTGFLTNNSSFVSLNMIIGSNLVATTTDLIGRINTGSSTNLIMTVNGSAGLLQTQAQFERRTNTFQGATFLNNIIQTNTSLQRIYVRVGQIMPTGVATHSAVEGWTVGAGVTSQVGIVQSPLGVAGQYTNNIAFWVNPGELFWVSNVNVGAGAPVAMPDKFTISSF